MAEHYAASPAAAAASASAAAASPSPSPTKHKKLSEKGKAKLADHRAHERLAADLAALEQQYAEAHPELIDENGEMEMPLPDALFGDGMTHEARLGRYVAQEREALENAEMVRKLAKLQRKHNTMQNALLKGNRVGAGYDRDTIDLKVVQRQLKKARQEEETREIVLDEAIPLYRDACNAAAKGQKALFAYLEQESILRQFSQADPRYLKASVDATLDRRKSALNFRVEVVWRVAVTIQEWKRGERELNLRLALHSYNRLLGKCDPELHPFQYAGLHNTRELCELELERATANKILAHANHDPMDMQQQDAEYNAMFKFERKR